MTDGLHQVTSPSAVILNERRYPIIYEAPTWGQIFGNLRSDDYKLVGAAAAIGAPWGYWIGYKYYLQKSSARMGVLFFTAAALGHVAQMSTARLMGVEENSIEVKEILNKPGR